MTPEKIRQLEELGFHWSVRESRTPWNARLEELKEYKGRFGDCCVPKNWDENPSLSYWVEKVCGFLLVASVFVLWCIILFDLIILCIYLILLPSYRIFSNDR